MKRLIITAEDYGLTEGVSRGIREVCRHGSVTSVSVLMNLVSQDDLIALKELNSISSGVHLNITKGKPLLPAEQVKSLTDENGFFLPRWEKIIRGLERNELEEEWRAQIQKFLAFSLPLTHLSSHQHVHIQEPALEVAIRLAKEHKVPLRSPTKLTRKKIQEEGVLTTDDFIYTFYDEPHITIPGLKGILSRVQHGITEMTCHPGIVTEALFLESSYSYQRGIEMATLSHEEARNTLSAFHIHLISYHHLLKRTVKTRR